MTVFENELSLALKINQMHLKTLFLLIFAIISNPVIAQNNSINFESFDKYSTISMGLSYINFTGVVSEFTKSGGSLDMNFGDGRGKHFYGLNINIAFSNNVKEFSIPQGYEHYNTLPTLIFGLYYGNTIGNPQESHFFVSIGINYGWLIHRKIDDDIGGYRGLIPQIEFGRSIQVGKNKFSDYQYTSQYTPMKYDPSINNQFIDFYIGYKQLLLNNDEGKGGLVAFGIRYKINTYSISKNLNYYPEVSLEYKT